MKPIFIDNRDGNTLEKAIIGRLEALRNAGLTPEELCISSAYFNPQGLELLSKETKHLSRIRLLLGAEPTPEALLRRRTPFDPPEPVYTNKQVHTALEKLERSLRFDRDHIPFDIENDKAIRTLLEFLNSGKIEVHRYTKHFLHAKAFIFCGDDRGILAGSSNLTYAGLRSNLELNLGHYEDPLVSKVEQWFNKLWEEAPPFDLASIYEELLACYDPYLIYLKILWHLYHSELEEEEKETGHIPITNFQKHGVWRAKKILEKYDGVLIADGVGLGKTYTAGEIIREYRENRQRVLLVCPASLRDTSWKKFLNDFQLLVERVSYEQLANDIQLGGDYRYLQNSLEDYALVVVDEAHNYRNPDTPARAAVMRKLLSGKRRDLLLLTATPVNNSLWDLYHIQHFFMKQDAVLADKGVISIRDRFDSAMQTDPFNLNPDLLYPIIDATTVKRTRRFVKKYYKNDMIKGPDGILIPINFPKPLASSIKYELEEVLPGFFERFEEILMPAKAEPLLKMARYQPERYLKTGATKEDTALVGLLRSALLKRFESSAYAFCQTVSRLIEQHKAFLNALDWGKVASKEFFKELSAAGDEGEIEEILEASEYTDDAIQYDIARLKKDVSYDLELLIELKDAASSVRPENNPKIDALIEELVSVIEEAEAEAIDDEDSRQKRKVLVFSHFEETIDWIENHITQVVNNDSRLKHYKGRIASISGRDSRNRISRDKAIHGFAPISTEALPPEDEDCFDLLFSTDVLAEGMNLQQCRNIINYDLPWNPMRLVQRHGRIDRIGSTHKKVFLRTFFPDKRLDDLLNLEERVRRKLAQAAASVGLEETPIEEGAYREQIFTETRDEIEKLLREDASIYEEGGTESAAQTGEEYRQELRKAIERFGDKIERLSWRIGTGMVKGEKTGHMFCATVGDRIYLRFVPIDSNNPIITELGTCLRLIECTEYTPAKISSSMAEAAYGSWKRARENIFNAWSFETDPANLQPKVRKLNREVAEFIRKYPPSDIPQERLQQCLDAVESPWSRREENQLRIVWKQENENNIEKSRLLVKEIEKIGAEPFHPPDPLPPINPKDINLICWMAIEQEKKNIESID